MSKKAVCLVSGGLDSMLIVSIMKEQGFEVFPVHFDMGFSGADLRKIIRPKDAQKTGIDLMKERGVKVQTIDIAKDFYRDVIQTAPHGYGSAINPCIDCKIYMIRRAYQMALELGSDFVVTGEVLNQRPMSQRKSMLKHIINEADLKGRILRPLSAKLLAPTIPEEDGRVDRSLLFNIEGRGRKRQFELARRFGIEDYETPAGGCLLTEKGIAKRGFDLFKHCPDADFSDFSLIRVARHFRISPKSKLIVGKNFHDNRYLKELAGQYPRELLILDAEENPGPIGLFIGARNQADLELAERIVARYGDPEKESEVIRRDKKMNEISRRNVRPVSAQESIRYLVSE